MMPANLRPLIDAVVRAAAAQGARSAAFWTILVREGEEEAVNEWGDGKSERAALMTALQALESAISSLTEDR